MVQRDATLLPGGEPLWYKDAIIYELHVRAFYDSDGDGIGDFRGLTEKLDYLHELGVTAVWLLPFYPSPLKDDGYDIADYTNVHPSYGTLRDVKEFIREAHRRGLRVITELVCNHTSDQHPWFRRARESKPGSSLRDFYVWSDTTERYKDARIIFKDFETSNWSWDPVAKSYYWHRFYSHQPDLNYDNPLVRKAVFRVMDFWLQLGVDGLRLDAVPYLFEREGTNCENLPETHAFLKALRAHIDANFPDRMLLAEANQWPEDSVAYFGDGDECNMAFHFPLMPRMFMAIRMEDRFPIIDILSQTPAIPECAQWALFLRNHDELTLEMVTDEERDYMYRVYAKDPEARINLGIRRRLGPLLGNHRRRIELMNGLLFSLPGSPLIYYGDEIGMGDNIYLGDRNGVRTPMQWSADRNAGFSKANPQRLYLPVIVDPEYHYATVNVQAQCGNPHSLLSWMKRLIALRKRHKAFGRGNLQFLYPENRKVLAFTRRYREETILVVANLSRFVQHAEINLSEFKGMVPVELWGQVEFPPIREEPYFLTLGPHAFYWFSLEPQRVQEIYFNHIEPETELPVLVVSGSWNGSSSGPLLQANGWRRLAELLPSYLQTRRWFRGKARRIRSTQFQDAIGLPFDGDLAYLSIVQVDYTEGDPEVYLLPLAFATGERADQLLKDAPRAILARVLIEDKEQEGIIYDALLEPSFADALLKMVTGRRRLKGLQGELRGSTTSVYRHLFNMHANIVGGGTPPQQASTGDPVQHVWAGGFASPRRTSAATPTNPWTSIPVSAGRGLEPKIMKAEQSNTSIVYGEQLIMKLFRRLEIGTNPDVEIGRFLSEKGFTQTPPSFGLLEYQRKPAAPMTVALLQGFVPNMGDAWQYTIDSLANFFQQALASHAEASEVPLSTDAMLDLAEQTPPPAVLDLMGSFMDSATLLGHRTAEMHLALADSSSHPSFAPEPFTSFYQRSIYQSMRSLLAQVFNTLKTSLNGLPEPVREDARRVLDLEGEILNRFQSILSQKITASRIRCHGDYHLGQLLRTANDFVIIDFEGEPARPLSERRIKRCALRDVAGMLRSFHYASHVGSLNQITTGGIPLEQFPVLQQWARFWNGWVSTAFLKSYLDSANGASFLPQTRRELQVLLDAFLLEKAIYELGYEMNNRPDWVAIPAQGIPQLLGVARNWMTAR